MPDGLTVVELEPEGPASGDGIAIDVGPDGSLLIDFDPRAGAEAPARDTEDRRANLAEELDSSKLSRIGQKIVEWADEDAKSRQPWLDLYKRGLERCGALFGDTAGSGASGNDAKNVASYPLIMEAVVQFQARAIEEVFPAAGPVKTKIAGAVTRALEEQAERVERFMNYQCLFEDVEYFWDTDQMLFVLPLAGSCFKKTSWDDDINCVVSRYIAAEDVLIPYNFRGHISRAPRITHVYPLSHLDLQERQRDGRFLSADKARVQAPSGQDEGDRIDVRADQTTPSDLEEDREHTMLECHCRLDLYDDGEPLDVIVTVEKESYCVLSIRANRIKEGDDERRVCWFTHYKYLPGLGSYGYGLIHMIGGVAEIATDLVNEILLSAKFATRQGGFKSVDTRIPRKITELKPGVWHDTEMTADELQKAFYTPPFKETPPAIFNVLGLLTDFGRRFASVTEAMVGEGNNNVQVGTTIARIEQANKVYSGIHKRIHKAAAEEFALRARLNAVYLTESRAFEMGGGVFEVSPEDFDGRIDVVPVSDPNVTSTPQRIALAEAQVARAAAAPHLYDALEVERRYLEALKVSDIDRVLVNPEEVQSCDPVTEGQLALMRRPFRAFAEQDHAAHMVVHQGQIQMVQGSPMAQAVVPALMAHIAEHMAHQYRIQMSQQLGVPLPEPSRNPREQRATPPEMDAQISAGAAQIVAQAQAQAQAQQAAMEQAAAQEQGAGRAPQIPPEIAQRDLELGLRAKELDIEGKAIEVESKRRALEQPPVAPEPPAPPPAPTPAQRRAEELDLEEREARAIKSRIEVDRLQREHELSVSDFEQRLAQIRDMEAAVKAAKDLETSALEKMEAERSEAIERLFTDIQARAEAVHTDLARRMGDAIEAVGENKADVERALGSIEKMVKDSTKKILAAERAEKKRGPRQVKVKLPGGKTVDVRVTGEGDSRQIEIEKPNGGIEE